MRRGLALALVLPFALAGCGSDGDAPPSGSGGSQPPVALSGTTNDHGSGAVSGGTVELELGDYYFGPTYVQAPSGAQVKVVLRNEGSATHTFTTAGGVDRTLRPNERLEVPVAMPAAPLHFYCRFHRDQGMQGAFYATAGGSVSSAPGEEESPERY